MNFGGDTNTETIAEAHFMKNAKLEIKNLLYSPGRDLYKGGSPNLSFINFMEYLLVYRKTAALLSSRWS